MAAADSSGVTQRTNHGDQSKTIQDSQQKEELQGNFTRALDERE